MPRAGQDEAQYWVEALPLHAAPPAQRQCLGPKVQIFLLLFLRQTPPDRCALRPCCALNSPVPASTSSAPISAPQAPEKTAGPVWGDSLEAPRAPGVSSAAWGARVQDSLLTLYSGTVFSVLCCLGRWGSGTTPTRSGNELGVDPGVGSVPGLWAELGSLHDPRPSLSPPMASSGAPYWG